MPNARKSLSDMPDAVRASVWANMRHYSRLAECVCWLEEKLYVGVAVLARFAWWVVVYWVLFARIPVDAIADGIPKVRNFIVVTFALTMAMALVTHWIGIQLFVPRADKAYPVLGDACVTSEFKWLALPMLVFSALLFLSCHHRTHGAVHGTEHLPAAMMTLAMGLACLWLNWRPLTYGYQVATEHELGMDAVRRQAASQRSLQPQAGQEYATPISPSPARTSFSAIQGMAAVKEKLLAPARAIIGERSAGAQAPCNGILLHGEPGNGKHSPRRWPVNLACRCCR
jgi:hypothetical protein